ncbi:hypothetical protein EVAR_23775_1 [Eumeta japonica]|uniref:Uncharacterized protein n=1 Tax=Eumeta variegata TaxID=151549 RepID=A0A4C1VJ50_EUMVA|nr:hypothetical protein EVAR_23775_1 [Eumeta japonica]
MPSACDSFTEELLGFPRVGNHDRLGRGSVPLSDDDARKAFRDLKYRRLTCLDTYSNTCKFLKPLFNLLTLEMSSSGEAVRKFRSFLMKWFAGVSSGEAVEEIKAFGWLTALLNKH